MLHLTGQYLGAQHIEARTDKEGTKWPERWRLQIMTREELDNGSEAIDVQHLPTVDPDQVKAFSALIGKTVSIAVRAYASGRAVAYAIQPGALPQAATIHGNK
jgi:hypothetical protein